MSFKFEFMSFRLCCLANFTLPSTEFGWFDEIQFVELPEEEAKKKVLEFNEKGKKANKDRERDNHRTDRRRGKYHYLIFVFLFFCFYMRF